MKDLLSIKMKLKYDENIYLTKECSEIILRKLPPKLKDLGRFTIPYTISKLKIEHALCGLGEKIKLMPLSMLKKHDYGEVKPTNMTLTLADLSMA